MTIAACMIVKDGAATVARAIESVRPHIDEIVVYLAGESSDGTPERLAELAAKSGAPIVVEQGEWRDDYAWAREQSFAMVSPETDWVISMDADEITHHAAGLRRLGELPEDVSHVYVLHGALEETVDGVRRATLAWRLLVTRPGACRWERPIHETLQPLDEHADGFAFAVPSAIQLLHPLVQKDRHNETMIAAAAAETDPTAIVNVMGAMARAARGDAEGFEYAEAVLREYLRATPGRLDELRYLAWSNFADICGLIRRDDDEVNWILRARDAERDVWRRKASAGELVGIAALGPDLGKRLDDRVRIQEWAGALLEPGDPCACGSGLTLERCCADRVFLLPSDLRPAMTVDPGDVCVKPLCELAWELCAQGRFEEAVPMFDQLRAIVPAHPLLALVETDPRVLAAMLAARGGRG